MIDDYGGKEGHTSKEGAAGEAKEQGTGDGIIREMSTFNFDLVSEAEAKTFWEDSPHASVFTNPTVLSRMGSPVDWWVARKGNEPICMWPVCRPDGTTVGLP